MQGTPSSATGSALSWQPATASQVSTPVQYSPSSQLPSLTAFTITSLISSQLSTVQATPSSGSGSALSWQPSNWSQLSTPVQNSPSSQKASLTAFTITSLISSQLSTVQATLSSATGSALSTQPRIVSQLSTPVQNSPSSHTGAIPPTQAPATQVSAVVQASESSQASVLLLLVQAWVTVSQASSVQPLRSSQSAATGKLLLSATQPSSRRTAVTPWALSTEASPSSRKAARRTPRLLITSLDGESGATSSKRIDHSTQTWFWDAPSGSPLTGSRFSWATTWTLLASNTMFPVGVKKVASKPSRPTSSPAQISGGEQAGSSPRPVPSNGAPPPSIRPWPAASVSWSPKDPCTLVKRSRGTLAMTISKRGRAALPAFSNTIGRAATSVASPRYFSMGPNSGSKQGAVHWAPDVAGETREAIKIKSPAAQVALHRAAAIAR